MPLSGKKGDAMPVCGDCGRPDGRRRRCTGETLCEACRRAPAHRILPEALVLRHAPLSAEDLAPLVVGVRVNSVNPRFAPERVYRWHDVLLLLDRHGLPVPPELE